MANEENTATETHLAADIMKDVATEASLLHIPVADFLGEEEPELLGAAGSDGSLAGDPDQAAF